MSDPLDPDHELDLDFDLTPPAVGAQYHPAETEEVLLHLREVIVNARPVPLSASSMISKEEVLDLVDDALEQLPEELRAARWLLKEREEYLARMRHEGDEILAAARARAEHMVQRAEVVKAAEQRAYEILEAANADARRLRHEVEDFCDQKLASFEIVLERTQTLVAAGRAKLQGTNLLAEAAAAALEQETDDLDSEPIEDDSYRDPQDRAEFDQWGEPDQSRPGRRLTVVDDSWSDLPPPPDSPATIRDAAASFFDQDLD